MSAVFKKKVRSYYLKHGRILPWRETVDPYKIFVSELMLQQTQAERVIPKYQAFIKKFPTVQKLARAPKSEILRLWQGLGYNRRALFLHQSAQRIVELHGGVFPESVEDLEELPGVGPYTARAIRVFAYNQPEVFIETNIRTVFIAEFFTGKKKIPDTKLFTYIEKTLDRKNPREWYSALMDYGSMLKKTEGNASRKSAHYVKQSAFKDSDRQIRGNILKIFSQKKALTKEALFRTLPFPRARVNMQLTRLIAEGFLEAGKSSLYLAR